MYCVLVYAQNTKEKKACRGLHLLNTYPVTHLLPGVRGELPCAPAQASQPLEPRAWCAVLPVVRHTARRIGLV